MLTCVSLSLAYFYGFAENVITRISAEHVREDFIALFWENLTRKSEYLKNIFYGRERFRATSIA